MNRKWGFLCYSHHLSVCLQKYALVVQGPRDVKKKELVFLQFHLNETDQDFSAIDYLLFSSFQEFINRYVKGWACNCIELAPTILVKAELLLIKIRQAFIFSLFLFFLMFGLLGYVDALSCLRLLILLFRKRIEDFFSDKNCPSAMLQPFVAALN